MDEVRLIDANKLKPDIHYVIELGRHTEYSAYQIEHAETVYPQVTTWHLTAKGQIVCVRCKEVVFNKYNEYKHNFNYMYCPYCGAKAVEL